MTRRAALAVGAAAVVGLGVGIAGTALVQNQKVNSLNSTISNLNAAVSSLNTSLASENTSVASLQSNLSTAQSQLASQPFFVDTVNKQIVLQATVNNASFTATTVHSIVWDQGKNASMAMFTPTSTPEELYNGMVALGAVPGNTVQLTSAKGTLETGTPVNVSVTWEGAPQVYTLQQLMNDYTGDFVFGGNLATNTSLGTGCEVCIQSCAVGIVSSGTIGWETGVGWTLNSTLVPKGQAVTIYLKPQL